MKRVLLSIAFVSSLLHHTYAGELAPLLLVVNKNENTVAFVDAPTLKTIGLARTGHHPHEIAVAPDGGTAFIANYGAGDSLSVIDIPKREEVRRIALGAYRDPHGIQVGQDGRLYVTCEASRAVVVLDPSTGKVLLSIATGQDTTHMLVLTPGGTKLYTANLGSASATAIDLKAGKVVAQVPTGAGCEGIDVTPDGREVWTTNKAADTITVIDVATDRVLATLPCSRRPIRVKFTPDGHRALIACARSDAVAVFDVAQRVETRRIATGAAPIGMVIDPLGSRAYVANTDANEISVIDLNTLKVVGTIPTGREPDGLALVGTALPKRPKRD
ncbi:MAG: beta-propeller fold lactonase family protein [Isosphaeraceae bacterium]|nr:beta-propeller fold lactonase family protein [Isosphaeraceae bacterium]